MVPAQRYDDADAAAAAAAAAADDDDDDDDDDGDDDDLYILFSAGEEYNFCNHPTQDKHIDK